jgi:hypothetical protein
MDFLGLAIGNGPARDAEMDLIPNYVRDITGTSDSTWADDTDEGVDGWATR